MERANRRIRAALEAQEAQRATTPRDHRPRPLLKHRQEITEALHKRIGAPTDLLAKGARLPTLQTMKDGRAACTENVCSREIWPPLSDATIATAFVRSRCFRQG